MVTCVFKVQSQIRLSVSLLSAQSGSPALPTLAGVLDVSKAVANHIKYGRSLWL